MIFKTTMAIIGAASATGTAVAKSMASNYQLLLMDSAEPSLTELRETIVANQKIASVDTLLCCKEASWEADVVVVAVDEVQLASVAQKIKEVTTCKPVIHFTGQDGDTALLQRLLPYAHVVSVCINNPEIASASNYTDAFVHGSHQDASEIAKEILFKMDCTAK